MCHETVQKQNDDDIHDNNLYVFNMEVMAILKDRTEADARVKSNHSQRKRRNQCIPQLALLVHTRVAPGTTGKDDPDNDDDRRV